MRVTPEPEVLAWVAHEPMDTLYTTTVSEAEIRVGIALLPEGRRRRELAAAAERLFAELFKERVLPFDGEAARAYGAVG